MNCAYSRARLGCFLTYPVNAAAFVMPPILFVTFREMYGLSYTQLGSLVLVGFATQLIIDLVFTFFSKRFNIRKCVLIMPLMTSGGLLLYALVPSLLPSLAYPGLLVGTVIFSMSAGLSEVLISPLVASLPSEHPERDMSSLHSLYAYGVLGVVLICTGFFLLFGRQNWMYLTGFFALLPLVNFCLFSTSRLPEIPSETPATVEKARRRTVGLALCATCIFLGSAAENTMTNWLSGYVENALHLPKTLGDLLGMAPFAILLGLARTLYAKRGKHIYRVLLLGMTGAVVCYLVAGFSPHPVAAVIACVLTGFCTSMLWPGTLILMEEQFPNSGVAAYALMAAGGDLGGSIAPQLQGIVSDVVAADAWASQLGQRLSLTPEQVGMKAGMVVSALFPMLGIVVLLILRRFLRRKQL